MLALPRRTLADLPSPSPDIFAPRHPWCPIPARALTGILNIDPGLLGVWRMRGVGPKALPAEWTRGRSLTYLISDVMAWLAARRGEPFDTRASHLDYLRTNLGDGFATAEWVRRLAEREGPVQGGVTFTPHGWRSYLASLPGAPPG